MENRGLLNKLNNYHTNDDLVKIEKSKRGCDTLKLVISGKEKYIHSKYDPELEAKRLLKSFEIQENTKHVIVFGIGLGYHISELMERFPQINISIYEPNKDVLSIFLEHYDLQSITNGKLTSIFTKNKKLDLINNLQNIKEQSGKNVEIFVLPSYEELYQVEINELFKTIKESLKGEKSRLVTNVRYQKRWTLNAVKNLPKVLDTPNILTDINQETFKDKPAVIVSAGPSLNSEFGNLRYIKENRLAYIFSVGSAINALIENNIYPDATLTYDPKKRNQIVLEKLKKKNIKNIPLIFGSTVGFETIEDYPGPLLHMITSQDTVAPSIINKINKDMIIYDAPSIAIITFQLLAKLGVNEIYLVGQNLSYQGNYRYAKGIDYRAKVNTQDMKLLTVKDVYGNDIYTDEGYNQMRKQLEMYIKAFNYLKVYNTTKNGADIEGTKFIPLEEVISSRLKKNEVSSTWYKTIASYNNEGINNKIYNLQVQRMELISQLEKIQKMIDEFNKIDNKNHSLNLEQQFNRFDKLFKKITKNRFYKAFISSMIRVEMENLVAKSKEIKYEKDIVAKANKVSLLFEPFIEIVNKHFTAIDSYFEEMIAEIQQD